MCKLVKLSYFPLHFRLDKELSKLEHDHGLQARPLLDSDVFKEFQYHNCVRQLDQLKKRIEILARERWFLLALKAKFAGKFNSSSVIF